MEKSCLPTAIVDDQSVEGLAGGERRGGGDQRGQETPPKHLCAVIGAAGKKNQPMVVVLLSLLKIPRSQVGVGHLHRRRRPAAQ